MRKLLIPVIGSLLLVACGQSTFMTPQIAKADLTCPSSMTLESLVTCIRTQMPQDEIQRFRRPNPHSASRLADSRRSDAARSSVTSQFQPVSTESCRSKHSRTRATKKLLSANGGSGPEWQRFCRPRLRDVHRLQQRHPPVEPTKPCIPSRTARPKPSCHRVQGHRLAQLFDGGYASRDQLLRARVGPPIRSLTPRTTATRWSRQLPRSCSPFTARHLGLRFSGMGWRPQDLSGCLSIPSPEIAADARGQDRGSAQELTGASSDLGRGPAGSESCSLNATENVQGHLLMASLLDASVALRRPVTPRNSSTSSRIRIFAMQAIQLHQGYVSLTESLTRVRFIRSGQRAGISSFRPVDIAKRMYKRRDWAADPTALRGSLKPAVLQLLSGVGVHPAPCGAELSGMSREVVAAADVV